MDFLRGWYREPLEQLEKSAETNSGLIRIVEQHEAGPLRGALKMRKDQSIHGLFCRGESQQSGAELLSSIHNLARVCDRFPMEEKLSR
jgi:hypothetical protein